MKVSPKAIEEYLKSRGFRLTAPRRAVIRKLLSLKGHVAVEDIVDLMRRDRIPVSRATIYRTLALIGRSGLINGHDFEMRKKLYEPMVGRSHHDHLFCVTCGKVIEFSEEGIERLQRKVAARYGFTPVHHSHMIFGTCGRCTPRKKKS